MNLQIIATTVPVIVGALIAFVPNYLLDRRRERMELRKRWDSHLFELCSQFASSARGFQELCLQWMHRRKPSGNLHQALDDEHQLLRTLSEQVRLLGDTELQLAVRWVVRHAYAMREVAEGRDDPRGGEFTTAPFERFGDALQSFYHAARLQLHVPNAAHVAPRDLEPGRQPITPQPTSNPQIKTHGPPPETPGY
jgi:hypothetical protein